MKLSEYRADLRKPAEDFKVFLCVNAGTAEAMPANALEKRMKKPVDALLKAIARRAGQDELHVETIAHVQDLFLDSLFDECEQDLGKKLDFMRQCAAAIAQKDHSIALSEKAWQEKKSQLEIPPPQIYR